MDASQDHHPANMASGDTSSITVDPRVGPGSSSNNNNSNSTNNNSSLRMKTPRRQPKDASKPKSAMAAGDSLSTRFQCPKCPKNFSRIENLTRHQANHDEVGKFACVVCRKRFTRSDLLNRHRRIHGPQPESSEPHVTQPDFNNTTTATTTTNNHNVVDSRPVSDVSSGYTSSTVYQSHMPPPLYAEQNSAGTDGYQHQVQHGPNTGALSHHAAHGLTSLMEAALAPQQTFSFAPLENTMPLLWDGFMPMTQNTSTYMGAYDADMSWTLDYLPSEGSPNYLMDHDMMNAFDDYSSSSSSQYQYPPQAAPTQFQQTSHPVTTDDAEGDEEDTSDWPDKVEQSASPKPPRIVPVHMQTINWHSTYEEARSTGLCVTTIHPAQTVNSALREAFLLTLNAGTFGGDGTTAEISDAFFPPVEVLDFFMRLYTRYIQPRFPILHLPTLNIYNVSPSLLLAMMFLGSSHSRTDGGRFSRLFHERLRIYVMRLQEVDKSYMRSIDNILTYFLLCLAGTWSGSKHAYEFAEGGRGILVTACRRSRLLDCRPAARVKVELYQRPGISSLQAVWLAWIESEKRKRLGLSIYNFDCQYPALFNNQPYVSKAETTNCAFPCPEEYWDSPSADSWKILVGTADTPPSMYYLHALNCCLLRKWIKPAPPIAKTGEWGKVVLIYALHTHIFEWRQSVSMLKPTGLQGTFGNSAHDIGEGLRERRRWLVDGLDSFGECYLTPGTSVAASLLYHLGYISLDVSLSDMHLVAGRSVHQLDGNFAEENLKFWANSEMSATTMSHVYNILEICHHSINTGMAADSSYEIAIGLFTAGIICWTFAKLRHNAPREQYINQVRRASLALRQMDCWRMCSMFGKILDGFEAAKMPIVP